MFNYFIKFFLPVAALALIGFAVWHVRNTKKDINEIHPAAHQPAASDYHQTVAGTGIIESRNRNVAIGTPVPGIVTKLNVAVNQKDPVKKGDILFEIDDSELQAELVWKKAAAQAAKAELQRLESSPRQELIPVSQAAVEEAKASLSGQEDMLRRAERLTQGPNQALSLEDLTQRKMAYNMAQAHLQKAEAELKLLLAGTWKADIEVSKAAVAQAEAQIEQLNLRIARTKVKAPADGSVLQVNIREGEYAGSGTQTLIMIGQIDVLNIRVDIDELDIPRFLAGSDAYAMLKGGQTDHIPLKYEYREPYVVPKQSLTGLNTERVDTRVMQVVYSVKSSKIPLQVGQQVDVFINAAEPEKK